MEIEKQYNVVGDLAELQNILINIEYYGRLHPLIKAVKKIENGSNEYKIKERPYNWIPIHINYLVQVKSFEKRIEYKIIGIPFAKVRIRYSLNQIDKKDTEIIFRLEIDSKLIGKKILGNKMMDAQNQLIKSINEELSSLRIQNRK